MLSEPSIIAQILGYIPVIPIGLGMRIKVVRHYNMGYNRFNKEGYIQLIKAKSLSIFQGNQRR